MQISTQLLLLEVQKWGNAAMFVWKTQYTLELYIQFHRTLSKECILYYLDQARNQRGSLGADEPPLEPRM